MIAAATDMQADVLAYYHEDTYVILLNLAIPPRVRAWMADQLLALVAANDADLSIRIPLGEAVLMFGAPLADGS